ncbi:hypothetical protein D3C84_931840 [compost metagenome]
MVFAAVRNSELIHNAALNAIELVLRPLSKLGNLDGIRRQTGSMQQRISGHDLDRSGGGQSGAVRNFAVIQQFKAAAKLHAALVQLIHNSFWVIHPVIFLIVYDRFER